MAEVKDLNVKETSAFSFGKDEKKIIK